MTADAIMVVRFIFSTIWRFFNSWYIPGTRVTPAMWFIFMLFVLLVFRTLKRFGFLLSDSSTSDKEDKG